MRDENKQDRDYILDFINLRHCVFPIAPNNAICIQLFIKCSSLPR